MSDLFAYAREVLATVDPTVTAPVYLVDAADAAAVLDTPKGIGAFTAPLLSYRLKPILEARGEWNGPGFAAVVVPGWFETIRHLAAGVLHEYSHAAPYQTLLDAAFPCGLPDAAPAWAERTDRQVTLTTETEERPWTHHGPDFARLAMHATHRLNAAGGAVDPAWVFTGRWYLLSAADQYLAALGDEPERLASLPLAEVAKVEAPASFRDFAAADLARAEEMWNSEDIQAACRRR